MVSSPVLIIALWTVLFSICSGLPLLLPYNQQRATITTTAIDTKTAERVSLRRSPTVESSQGGFNANQNGLNRQLPGDSHFQFAKYYVSDSDDENESENSAPPEPEHKCAPIKAQYVRCFNWIKHPSFQRTFTSSTPSKPDDEEYYRFWTPGIFIAAALMLVPVTMALVDFAEWIAGSLFPIEQCAIELTEKGALVPPSELDVDELPLDEEFDILIP